MIIYLILGVGPKPVSAGDTKGKGKTGTKGPQPGDIGFLKLNLLNTPLSYNDGRKSISVKYDYCSFSSGVLSFVIKFILIRLFRLGGKKRDVHRDDVTCIQSGGV